MSSSCSEYTKSPEPEPATAPPVSPRKRRRSSSADSTRSRKRSASVAPYNDAYRLLYNDFVRSTTGCHYPGLNEWKASQMGVSKWSASEKDAFFKALERLGKDDLPGLAAAVRSKSVPEIRQFILLLQDAALNCAGKRTISLEDIPAATEISVVCERKLDAAGESLALLQERFEAAQEEKRYGEYWLITADLANEIELAVNSTRASMPAESGEEVDVQVETPLIQNIPEARLLIPKTFLEMSRNVFMNPSPSTSYPWPNWQDLASELADEPCMYRTALRDFHTLVLSITKRVMQTALIQATSRIRSQGWRTSKGVKQYVRSRDVHTALGLLGMKKSRGRYWQGVPRRCRVLVTQGKWRKTRVIHWGEVERILRTVENMPTPFGSGTDTEGSVSDAEKQFKFRALRSGTPLPPRRQSSSDHSDQEYAAMPEKDEDSDTSQESEGDDEPSEVLVPEEVESVYDSSEAEEEGLEALDQEASRQEECKLWTVVGNIPADIQASLDLTLEERSRRTFRRGKKEEGDDWRNWTSYHAEWEEYHTPVPNADFLTNKKTPSPSPTLDPAAGYESEYATDLGRSSQGEGKSRTGPPAAKELPLRDARSYAALLGRQSQSADRDVESDAPTDIADVPAQSIEEVGHGDAAAEDEEHAMEWE
ncbi:hypothetical protein BU23DRAFT_561127 [Bimuria novae-zelandiae CBS 107.79]|uniref:Myb-like domain-containing protein n=1 Tax=Bimuria novae-zelandiae CBS 107.79 TaxID=1447943 RepID=A0A6A5UWI1_9PLEO|nr:hypothetical protein BU23DRAFT_561127 [Bimuria novae-zelandiae CBS 107.79]